MRTRLMVLAAGLVTGAPWIASAQHATRIDSIFARYAAPNAPGCVVGVSRNGSEVLTRAYGAANLEFAAPLTVGSILEAGSVSKQFTAAAIMLLVADGKLSLDDPVRKHVPELPSVMDPILLRHMLSHTSGLRDWGSLAGLAGWPRGLRAHTHAHVLEILSRQQALNFPPGTEYSYSNTGYNLLAIVVERVSGKTLDAFTQERIFQPLGMTSTQWRDDFTEVVPGRAVAYSPGRGAFRLDMPFEFVYGNGGLLTTVGDLLKWSENFRPGSSSYGRVGGQALVNALQTRAVLASGDTITYARGLVVNDLRGVPWVSHGGATGGYRAYLARFPRQELAIALLCNRGDANPGALAEGVAEVFLGDVLRNAQQAGSIPPERLERMTGLYRDTASGDVLRLFVRDGRLREGFGANAPPLAPSGPDRFRLGAPPNELRWVPASGAAPARAVVKGVRGRPVTYVAVAPATPAAETLAAYEGAYTSSELGVTYDVRVQGGRLTVQLPPGAPMPLEPLDADGFRGGSRYLRFTRDATGSVNGFELTTDRVYRLRFLRAGQ